MRRPRARSAGAVLLVAVVLHAIGAHAADDDGSPAPLAPPGHSAGARFADSLLALVGGVLVFLALAIVCDEYMCPCIEAICERLEIPDDIAGASLLALGSSAPEIIMNASGTFAGKIDLSLPAVLSSGLIAFGFIPPFCAAVAPRNADARARHGGGSLGGGRGFGGASVGAGGWIERLQREYYALGADRRALALSTAPVVRDACAYLIALAMLFAALADGVMEAGESFGLVVVRRCARALGPAAEPP